MNKMTPYQKERLARFTPLELAQKYVRQVNAIRSMDISLYQRKSTAFSDVTFAMMRLRDEAENRYCGRLDLHACFNLPEMLLFAKEYSRLTDEEWLEFYTKEIDKINQNKQK